MFAPEGTFISKFGSFCDIDVNNDGILNDPSPECNTSAPGAVAVGDGQFNLPTGVAENSNGDIFVVGDQNFRVQAFDSSGTFLFSFGSEGTSRRVT